jgi:nucleotide-binding universal stress UspA family protein
VESGTIVVSVDGSEASLRAWAYAVGVARRQNRKLLCVMIRGFVPPRPLPDPWSGADFYWDQLAAQLDSYAAASAQIVDDARAWDVSFHGVRRVGHPMTELRKVLAEEVNVGMLVIGGGTRIARRLAFAMACGAASRWPCPVVVVP